jgi:hypothetical protein
MMMVRAAELHLPNLSALAPTMRASACAMIQIDSSAPALRQTRAVIMVTP